MEMHDFLPALVKALMLIALGGLFLLMLFADKIRRNSKEKGGRNIVIVFGVGLAATLFFSVIAVFLMYENVTASLSHELMPMGAQIFSFLSIVAFLPALITCLKIAALLVGRKQKHA